MSNHEWKFGDWGRFTRRFRNEIIVRFIANDSNGDEMFLNDEGHITYCERGDIEYLPDCTGFDCQPKPVEPQYRPFANAAEFRPYRDKWWTYKESQIDLMRAPGDYSNIQHHGRTWRQRFIECIFEDGTPFGILVEPSPAEGGYE